MSKAIIGKPAPAFTAQAVMPGGEIRELSLSEYKGARVARADDGGGGHLFSAALPTRANPAPARPPRPSRQVRGLLLLPPG